MSMERKHSRKLNATLKHGNAMEAWTRQLQFMQYMHGVEVNTDVKAQLMTNMQEHAAKPPQELVDPDTDDDLEITSTKTSYEFKGTNSLGETKTTTLGHQTANPISILSKRK